MIRRLLSLIGRFRSDERGAFLALFGVCAVVLIAMSGAVVDYVSIEQARTRAQTALDSAALALQSQIYTKTPAQLSLLAQNLLLQSLGTSEGWKLCAEGVSAPCAKMVSATPNTANGSINLQARVDVPLYFVALVGIDHMSASVISEAARGSGSQNVEVALALDITGSMAGQKIIDLRNATQELINIVVQDVQTPTYSKVAIAPYSVGVNVGAYAEAVRGPIAGPTAISGATKTNPVVITTNTAHGLADGDTVYVSGVSGMTQINDKIFTVTYKTSNTFALTGVSGTGYGNYSGGGSSYCIKQGCQYYYFPNALWGSTLFQVSTCVSERTTNAYNDEPPSTTALGRNYSRSDSCPSSTIVPLSSNKAMLIDVAKNLEEGGGTAGHIGVAWGWYLVSPNFAYLWPAGSKPASKNTSNVLKAVVLMTDGDFNTAYCNGVVSKESGWSSDYINCNATNGSSHSQALAQCQAMKAAGIIVYTVGFDVGTSANARNVMAKCATDSSHAYLAITGADLSAAFRDIGASIGALRVTK